MRDSSSPSAASPVLLIEGGVVITMDDERRRFSDGYVLIRGGEISAVGSRDDLVTANLGPTERVDAAGCIVLPGLINTHQHPWYNLFKGLGGGMLLEQWIESLLAPTARAITPVDLEISGRLASLEMLAAGTTTFVNHSVTNTGDDEVRASIESVAASGMRQLFAKEIRPQRLDEQLEVAEAVHRRWKGAADERVNIGFVLESSAHWVAMGSSSEELIIRGNELAVRLGAVVSDHVAGGTMSREQGYLRYVLETGRTDVEFLHSLGVLDRHWILAHAINVTDRDIELIATSRATVSHTPTSEASRGAGVAPVRRLRDRGVTVHLGTDGPMVDTSVDMVEQMKSVLMFQNQLHRDPMSVSPEDAIAMATCEAARGVGLEQSIGSLEPGKRADVVIFDLGGPACSVWHDPVVALVQSAGRAALRDVLVDGQRLVKHGRFTQISSDEIEEVVVEARRRAVELLARSHVPTSRPPFDDHDRTRLGPIRR